MIINPDKFQSMIISSKKDLIKSVLNINGVELTMESSVKLLGIEIDNNLNFQKFNKVIISWRLVRPAADDDFVICRNAPYGQVLVLSSRCLVRPAADDDFVWKIHFQYLQKCQQSTKCNLQTVWKIHFQYLQKASNQLNTICRLQTFMGHKEKEAIINTFVHSNFNYNCLIWHFSSKKSQIKWKKFVKVV